MPGNACTSASWQNLLPAHRPRNPSEAPLLPVNMETRVTLRRRDDEWKPTPQRHAKSQTHRARAKAATDGDDDDDAGADAADDDDDRDDVLRHACREMRAPICAL